ncbi:DNA/RNA non-specific endonuclease [Paenibacillus rhizophilus]|uniref:DNA/RNA non-specific endonuclease n=1 Tax=Paenibacillus rhizophilus TaxID=1850366 RepID=UPI001FE3F321|nr:DNA/RNA non-specific endonuclease [Paenibacillus rhizophilus]
MIQKVDLERLLALSAGIQRIRRSLEGKLSEMNRSTGRLLAQTGSGYTEPYVRRSVQEAEDHLREVMAAGERVDRILGRHAQSLEWTVDRYRESERRAKALADASLLPRSPEWKTFSGLGGPVARFPVFLFPGERLKEGLSAGADAELVYGLEPIWTDEIIAALIRKLQEGTEMERVSARKQLREIREQLKELARSRTAAEVYRAFGNAAYEKEALRYANTLRTSLEMKGISAAVLEATAVIPGDVPSPPLTACRYNPLAADRSPLPEEKELQLVLTAAMANATYRQWVQSHYEAIALSVRQAVAEQQELEAIAALYGKLPETEVMLLRKALKAQGYALEMDEDTFTPDLVSALLQYGAAREPEAAVDRRTAVSRALVLLSGDLPAERINSDLLQMLVMRYAREQRSLTLNADGQSESDFLRYVWSQGYDPETFDLVPPSLREGLGLKYSEAYFAVQKEKDWSQAGKVPQWMNVTASFLTGSVNGAVDGVVGLAEGAYQVLRHPIQTGEAIGSLMEQGAKKLRHPVESMKELQGWGEGKIEAFREMTPEQRAYALGHAAGNTATNAIPVGKALQGVKWMVKSDAKALRLLLQERKTSGSRSRWGLPPRLATPEGLTVPGSSHPDFTVHEVRKSEGWGIEGTGKVPDKTFVDNPIDDTGKLIPNAQYKAGEHQYDYETDHLGRIEKFTADDLKLTTREERLPHDSNTPGKEPGDHAGHLAGDRFGGSPEIDNLVSQSSKINLSEYKKIENEWAKALQSNPPKHVSVEVKVNYEGDSLRPSSFNVIYEIDGKIKVVDLVN